MEPEAARLRIEYRPLSELMLQTWPGNPRKHSNDRIRRSILNNGFRVPPTWDPGTKRLTTGHGRLNELNLLWIEGMSPPTHVLLAADGRDWLIPVSIGQAFATELDAEAFVLADNHASDGAGQFEDLLADAMARALKGETLKSTGFDLETAEALVTFRDFAKLDDDDDEEDHTKWGDSDRGLLVDERYEVYRNATIKQVVVFFEGTVAYPWAQTVLARVRADNDLESNTEAVIYLLEQYAPDLGQCPRVVPVTPDQDA